MTRKPTDVKQRPKPAQQGGPDGLCGLYSLLNFIHAHAEFGEDEQDDNDREAFRYLLESTEQLGLLTAHHLHDGFEWHMLRVIFNHACDSIRLPYIAVPLVAVSEYAKNTDIFEIVKLVASHGGEVVAHLGKTDDHWILVHGVNRGRLCADDSALTDEELEKGFFISRGRSQKDFGITASLGLALVPKSSVLAGLS